MSIALRGKQILILVLLFLALLISALIVIHGVAPSLWHALVSFVPQIQNRYG